MDPYKHINAERNPDGSLTRKYPFPDIPATGDSAPADAVALSKDISLDPSKNTWVRLYLPRSIEPLQRLPIAVYFHGGGFILCNVANSVFHEGCSRAAAEVPAIVVSVEYRLAPEHRLPAAYDDAMDALRWLQGQAKAAEGEADPWLAYHGDFSRCYLMGLSAGGNIVYHVAVRSLSADLSPLRIVGLVLDQPFFGGVERTDSELRGVDDPMIPQAVNDLMWELSLPEGADRDHEFANPVSHRRRIRGEQQPSRLGLPRCLIRGHAGDPLIDRQKEMAKMLAEEEGVSVVLRIQEEGFHAVEFADPVKFQVWMEDLSWFVETAEKF